MQIHYEYVHRPRQGMPSQRRRDNARLASVVVVPAMALYGWLADRLAATAAVADWVTADEITVAVALDDWWCIARICS